MTGTLLSALLAAAPARAAGPPKPPPKPAAVAASTAPAAGVAASTAPARPPAVEDIYGGLKYRDPFMKLGAAGAGGPAPAAAAAVKEYNPEEFSIHGLELKGIMRDRAGPIALLVDSATHMTFILRGGRLLDLKKKPLPGITGTINLAQKTVSLMTADKDVQTMRLGEEANQSEE